MLDISIVTEYQNTHNQNLLPSIVRQTEHLIKKVACLAKKRNRNGSLDDFISCGYEGLMLAINKFDSTKSDNFEIYALRWIYAKINFFIMKNASILSLTGRESIKTFSNFGKLSQDPTPDFILVKNALHPTSSIFYNDTLEEKLSNDYIFDMEKEVNNKETKSLLDQEIEKFKKLLNKLELDVFENRLLNDDPSKLREVAARHHCSAQNIAAMEKKVFAKFKKRIETSRYKDHYKSMVL